VTAAETELEEPQAERWLTPGVRGIGGASLLADVGHEIPTSLLPSLLTGTLGAPAAALGVIEGVADGLAGAARFGGGALADDPQRRRAIAIGGYGTTAILSGLIGVANAVWQVGVLRSAAWAARGLRVPARNALLDHPSAPSSTPSRRRSCPPAVMGRPRRPRRRRHPCRWGAEADRRGRTVRVQCALPRAGRRPVAAS